MGVLVGAVGSRDVAPLLLEGLRRLQHRRHDCTGMVLLQPQGGFVTRRCAGHVDEFERALGTPPAGCVGLAHLRSGTSGAPSERNAHPQISHHRVAVVHNGSITNHRMLRAALQSRGYAFTSDTDTEVVAHLVDGFLGEGATLARAVQRATRELAGQFAIGVMATACPDALVVARQGRPLLIGVSDRGQQLVTSDMPALLACTPHFIVLEDGDVAQVKKDDVSIIDASGRVVVRPLQRFGGDRGNHPVRRRPSRGRERHAGGVQALET